MTVSDRDRRSPTRGPYLVQSTRGLIYLKALDTLLALNRRSTPPEVRPIKRLLVGIGGHLGDAIMATNVLPAIVGALPDVEIGVAAPSWTWPAIEGHPAIRWIHRVDHWKLNRSAAARLAKLGQSMATHREARSQIRAVGYDAAIDLYPFYPNMSILFARSRIPVRVGYESGGGGPAYTQPLEWSIDRDHMMVKQLRAVAELLGRGQVVLGYALPPVKPADEERALALLAEAALIDRYVVIHPGTGNSLKAWPLDHWLHVAKALVRAGRRVVITGAGATERAAAEWLRTHEPGIIDLSGRTNVSQLRGVFRRAAVVVASDSAAGHLSAAEGTPVVSIMAGISDPEQWKPWSDTGVALMRPVPCAPCFRPDGCAAMNCVRDVTVDAVLAATVQFSSSVAVV